MCDHNIIRIPSQNGDPTCDLYTCNKCGSTFSIASVLRILWEREIGLGALELKQITQEEK